MKYQEFQSSVHLSKHIECYWEMDLSPKDLKSPLELLSPDCTFDILITNHPVSIKFHRDNNWTKVNPGANFIGQKNNCISFSVKQNTRLFGIRFKPFAFANLSPIPLFHFNDQSLPLDQLFQLKISDKNFIQKIASSEEMDEKIELVEILLSNLLEKSYAIDQTLRAQTNYILDRKGLIKINNLFTEFGVSKVTLRKHFLNKLGLPPKRVSRIWRLNYFLQLKNTYPDYNLTELCLEAGFYDQAHFIKDFKHFFGAGPRNFFQYDGALIKISQEAISRRFSNQYDPRS